MRVPIILLVTLGLSPIARAAWPDRAFSPYLYTGTDPTPDLTTVAAATHARYFTLAFLIAGRHDPRHAVWNGDDRSPVSAHPTDPFGRQLVAGIAAVRAAGGDVMASFGGADGTMIDGTITDPAALAAEYRRIVDAYDLRAIDLDVEGKWAADGPSLARRSAAVAAVQASRPGLKVWFTLAVNPAGLTAQGLNILDAALAAGVHLTGVNVMAMDYGDAVLPHPAGRMGAAAVSAARATHDQLKALLARHGTRPTDGQLWAMVGVTPIVGVNDVRSDVFTPTDARQVLDFARQTGLGLLAFWQLCRDHPGPGQASDHASGTPQADYEFTRLWSAYNDGPTTRSSN